MTDEIATINMIQPTSFGNTLLAQVKPAHCPNTVITAVWDANGNTWSKMTDRVWVCTCVRPTTAFQIRFARHGDRVATVGITELSDGVFDSSDTSPDTRQWQVEHRIAPPTFSGIVRRLWRLLIHKEP